MREQGNAIRRMGHRSLYLAGAVLLFCAVAISSCDPPAYAKCLLDICDGEKRKTYNSRKVLSGDIYNPGHNRRLQIRDSRRRVLGYIERSGKVTDTRRRTKGYIK